MSRHSLLYITSSLSLALALSACGRGLQTSRELRIQGDQLRTGAFNQDSKPYTTFSATGSFEQLKAEVPQTPETLAFAKSIEKAQMNAHITQGSSELEIIIHWLGTAEPQVFKGSIIQNNAGVSGATLITKSGSKMPVFIDATCETAECDIVQSKIRYLSNNEVVGGIMFHNEERVLKTKDSGFVDPDLSARAKTFYESHKTGTPVKVRASVIVHGESRYEVTEGEKTILKGDLVSPEGDRIDLENGGSLKEIGHTDLVGNDEENGELIFLQEDESAPVVKDRPRPQFAFSVERPANKPPRTRPVTPTPTTPPTPDKPVRTDYGRGQNQCTKARPVATTPQIQAVINSLLKDCASSDTAKYGGETKAGFFEKSRRNLPMGQLENVLKIHEQTERQSSHPQESDAWGFQFMLSQMKQANMSAVLAAAITAVETGFFRNLRGRDGECGVMQFMPGTAREVGISTILGPLPGHPKKCRPEDGRVVYRTSMAAFARFLQKLDRNFPNNALMIMASYNGGPGRATSSQRNLENKLKNDRKLRSLTPKELSLMSNDFFWHKARGSLHPWAVAYTGKVAAAAQMLLNTQVYNANLKKYPSMKAQ